MSQNPYQTPVEEPQIITPASPDELAGRFTRFASAFVDGLLLMAVLAPIQYATGITARIREGTASTLEGLSMNLLSVVLFLVFHGMILFSRGQTIGKLLTKIQIVDAKTGLIPPPIHVYVLRYLWTLPVIIICTIIPGRIDDMILAPIVLIDCFLIFTPDRRCLHDLIAGTKVVLYREGRSVKAE